MYRYRTSRGVSSAAALISWVGAIFALIEVVYIVLQLFNANPGNKFFTFIRSLAEPLALFFPGLFNMSNHDLNVIITYGLAAVFWLIVTGFLARLVARV
ncbi:hypothetical protein [Nocardia alni]|uniref:hypothetical protein n=1 Tax=Nocardia alni TaxID=2815723 RepID=UPI001C222DD5|nr:hypothetical protein [Nocardia alni]